MCFEKLSMRAEVEESDGQEECSASSSVCGEVEEEDFRVESLR